MKHCLFLFLALPVLIFSGTIRLYNDSPFQLRAVVRGADGSYQGELSAAPNHYYSWTDSNTQFGIYDRKIESVTPYTVMWYCPDGGEYSICTNVATGATVTAQSCDGARQCTPAPRKNEINPNKGKGERLYTPPEDEQGTFQEFYPAPQ